MNWEDLRLFDAAASQGSLSAGAKALGISQPQMSRRLRELEQNVGARLFDRTPQGLRPTNAGAKLIPLAENMRKAAEAVARAQPDIACDRVSTVRISVDEIRERFLTRRMGELLHGLDGVRLEVFSGHEHLDHESRMTDVQIRSCLPDSDTLIAKRVGETSYGLFGTRELAKALAGGARKIEQSPWIGVSPDHLWYPLQKQWLDAFFGNEPILSSNSMTAMAHAASVGVGLTMLPHFMARDYDALVEIEIEQPAVRTTEYIVVHRDLLREPAVRKTVDALTDLYQGNRTSLSASSSA